jgi:hypothetical protein
VEIELLGLREQLEIEGATAEDIDGRIQKERKRKYLDVERMLDKDLKVEKEKEMDRLSSAFSMPLGYKEGDAFRFVEKKAAEDAKNVKRLENKQLQQ